MRFLAFLFLISVFALAVTLEAGARPMPGPTSYHVASYLDRHK